MAESLDRVDIRAKVTGQALYTEDLLLPPGALFCAILRSPYSHARVRSINIEKAKRLPGVLAVLTRDHLGGMSSYTHRSQPFIAMGKVRFQGEPVAGVAAESLAIAGEAVALIEVEYEELPAVFDVREARKPDTPLVHEERGGNLVGEFRIGWGDIEEGFRESDRTFEGSYFFPTVFHYPIENIGVCIASVRGGEIELVAPVQHPFSGKREVAELFGVEPDNVRIRMSYVGGGFGSKEVKPEHIIALCLARQTGRPVTFIPSVEDSFKTGVRHSMVWRAKTGVKSDGTLMALDIELSVDKGAYGGAKGAAVRGASLAWGPYRIPHLRVVAHSYYTNKVPAGAFRAVGRAQTTWGFESHYDMIARELGIDPMEFRLKNFYRRGDQVFEGTGPFDSDMDDLLSRAVRAIGWDGRSKRVGTKKMAPEAGSKVVQGKGMAVSLRHCYSGTSDAWVTVTVDRSGVVKVRHAGVEIGQGIYTMLARVAAETLGIPDSQVQVTHPDTNNPYFAGVGSSRSTVTLGNAAQRACEDLKRELREVAARAKGGKAEDWRFEGGRLLYGEQSFSIGDIVAAEGASLVVMGKGWFATPRYNNPWQGVVPHWNPSAAAAEVEVDAETGKVSLLQYANVADVGKAIHPLACRGQLDGGAIMGLGNTFYEEMVYRDGQLLNGDPFQYRLPLLPDLPEKFFSLMVENGDGPGPMGSKATAQVAVSPIAPAVANAIYEAIGVRITELPITPEKVLRALGKL
ncbi:MAG: xanthine dehydrogenase family protein molybdopterin-binding subunit [Deltaproteobacteria bacterium]|nr:xanthine dehydrogenase family protein molybdopterin-binding subunit [Deltaproteobacteria bacterium]